MGHKTFQKFRIASVVREEVGEICTVAGQRRQCVAVMFIVCTALFCSERRRLRKAQQMEEKKQQKGQTRENAGEKSTVQPKEHEEVDPRVFYENRCKFVEGLRKQNIAYPHKFNVCVLPSSCRWIQLQGVVRDD